MLVPTTPGLGPVWVSQLVFWPPLTPQDIVPAGRTAPVAPTTVAVKVIAFPREGVIGETVTAIVGVA